MALGPSGSGLTKYLVFPPAPRCQVRTKVTPALREKSYSPLRSAWWMAAAKYLAFVAKSLVVFSPHLPVFPAFSAFRASAVSHAVAAVSVVAAAAAATSAAVASVAPRSFAVGQST